MAFSFLNNVRHYTVHFNVIPLLREIAAFLAPLSRDLLNLTYLGIKDRLRELLVEEPDLVNAVHPRAGVTPLFCLPDDEDLAVQITELLLAHGADPRIKDNEGLAAEQVARNRGLIDAADLMSGEDDPA